MPDASFGGRGLLRCIGRPFSIQGNHLGFREAFLQILSAEVVFATKLIKANLATPEEKKMIKLLNIKLKNQITRVFTYHIILHLGVFYYSKSWKDDNPELFCQEGSLLSMNFNKPCFYMLFRKNGQVFVHNLQPRASCDKNKGQELNKAPQVQTKNTINR